MARANEFIQAVASRAVASREMQGNLLSSIYMCFFVGRIQTINLPITIYQLVRLVIFGLSTNEQYFSFTPNQPTVPSVMAYKPSQPKRTGRISSLLFLCPFAFREEITRIDSSLSRLLLATYAARTCNSHGCGSKLHSSRAL